MRFRHTRAKKNPIARWQGRLAKWKVASLFSARDDLWLRFESWPTRTQLQSHKAGGCASNLGRRERSYKVIKQAAPFRCPSGGDTVAGKFLSRDLKGRLPKAAPTRELSTAGCTGRPRLQGHARHSEDKDASCADQAAPRPAGPLARA